MKNKAPKERASKYRGVYRCGKKWKAQIQIGGIQHYLGVFDTEEKASEYYQTFALQHGRTIGDNTANHNTSSNENYSNNSNFPAVVSEQDNYTLQHESGEYRSSVPPRDTPYSVELRIALGKIMHAESVLTLALHENLCEAIETTEVLQLRQHILSRLKVLADCHKSLLGFIFSLDSSPAAAASYPQNINESPFLLV